MKLAHSYFTLTLFLAQLLSVFSVCNVSAQATYEEPDLSGPRSTMKFFLETMEKYKKNQDKKLLDHATKALNLNGFDQTSRSDSGKLASQRLVITLNKIEKIDLSSIPQKTSKDIWIYRKKNVNVDGATHPVEISIRKDEDDLWRFSQETIKSIEYYEKFLRDKKTVDGVTELTTWKTSLTNMMPAWFGHQVIILKNGQWLMLVLLIFFAMMVERLARYYVTGIILKLLTMYNLRETKGREKKMNMPIGVIAFSSVWLLGIRALELPDGVLSIFLRFGYIAFTVALVLATFYIVDLIFIYFERKAQQSMNQFDDILVPLIRKTLKFLVAAIGIIFIGDSLTLDMKGILAGLGIGGLAFAFAAKDTLSNILGSITVLVDRPFSIGDWIVIGSNVEGTVEEVGLRSTRVRTFYDSLITVPNGQLTNVHIDNYGKRTYRRLSTTIGVQYDTPPEKIEAFCEGIRYIISKHELTRKDYFHVYFNKFSGSSLDIMVYVFWRVPDWSSELAEKHKLLIDILRLGNEMNIEFAFPTQTLHMFTEDKKETMSIPDHLKFHDYGIEHANTIINNPVSLPGHQSGIHSRREDWAQKG